MNYDVDRYSVLIASAVLTFQLVLYFTRWSLLFVVALVVAERWSHLVEHNHVHVPMFRFAFLNEVFGWLVAFSTGVPVEQYRIHHVETHHRYENGPNDWTSPFAYRNTHFPDRPVNLLKYLGSFPVRSWYRSFLILLFNRHGRQRLRGVLGVAVLLTGSTGLFILNPFRFLVVFTLPWILLGIGAGLANWLHHVNCAFSDDLDIANDSRSIWTLSYGFNIGYHTAHHVRPSAHWSYLPAISEELVRAE